MKIKNLREKRLDSYRLESEIQMATVLQVFPRHPLHRLGTSHTELIARFNIPPVEWYLLAVGNVAAASNRMSGNK